MAQLLSHTKYVIAALIIYFLYVFYGTNCIYTDTLNSTVLNYKQTFFNFPISVLIKLGTKFIKQSTYSMFIFILLQFSFKWYRNPIGRAQSISGRPSGAHRRYPPPSGRPGNVVMFVFQYLKHFHFDLAKQFMKLYILSSDSQQLDGNPDGKKYSSSIDNTDDNDALLCIWRDCDATLLPPSKLAYDSDWH